MSGKHHIPNGDILYGLFGAIGHANHGSGNKAPAAVPLRPTKPFRLTGGNALDQATVHQRQLMQALVVVAYKRLWNHIDQPRVPLKTGATNV